MIKKIILVLSLVMLSFAAKSEDSHRHDHGDEPKKENPEKDKNLKAVEKKEKSDDGHGHDEPHSDHADEHGHGDENAQIGADKGILVADKDKGFKLSPETEANFKVEKIKVQSSEDVEIPRKALVTSTIEINVYRYRDGFYKRIDFDTISKNTTSLRIKSKDIKQGDEIATTGLGFLRVTEIAAFDGAPEGHAH